MVNSLRRRIEKLEKDLHAQSIVARTEDGHSFRIRRDNVLPLTVAAFRRCYADIEGAPMPVSRFDARLDQLKSTGVSSTAEPLLGIASDILRKTHEAGNE
jgi:hypothetical protein